MVNAEQYMAVLKPWVPALKRELHACQDRPELLFYGTGYNGWGVQTHQKAFAAAAVLASHERSGEQASEPMLAAAQAMLRYNLETHISGDYRCADGTQWGHTWISALGIERMMHGVEAIRADLSDKDLADLRRVLISESDWLLDHYEVVGGLYDKLDGQSRNKPESNIWNGALLHRTAALYPDASRAGEYRDKGTRFLLNGISIASDALSQRMYDGRPLSEWHEGPNFWDTYALNHHHYLNVGYMVICLSNVAMLHFYGKQAKLSVPGALYHNAYELWQLVKELIFPDGRLLRIGGDTRVPYCYCQDYAIPMWLLAEDRFGEDCSGYESGWLTQAAAEAGRNEDGGFLSERLDDLARRSPMYYTRLESDRAVSLSMGAIWKSYVESGPRQAADRSADDSRHAERVEVRDRKGVFAWTDEAHGAIVVKSERRIVSWVWEAAEKPVGLCLPPEASDLAEWRWNLAGRIAGIGSRQHQEVRSHRLLHFEGGFATIGAMDIVSSGFVSEGQAPNKVADHRVAFAALPDDCTAAVMQYAVSSTYAYIDEVKGLLLQVPNDVYNGYERRYVSEEGSWNVSGNKEPEGLKPIKGDWIDVEGKIAVVRSYGPQLGLYTAGKRNIHLKQYPWTDKSTDIGLLRTDQIVQECVRSRRIYHPGETMLDNGSFVMSSAGAEKAKAAAARAGESWRMDIQGGAVRHMRVPGADGAAYLLLANFGDEAAEARLQGALEPDWVHAQGQTYSDRQGEVSFRLDPLSIGVYRWKDNREEQAR